MSKKRKKPKTQFTDVHGNVYRVKITIPKLQYVRDEIDIDLGKEAAYIELSRNPIDFVNVLYCLLIEQVKKHKLTDVEFGESFDGDVIENAWSAFSEAYLSFCPSHQEKLLRDLMAKAYQTELVASEVVDAKLSLLVDSLKSASGIAEHSESSQETIPLENSNGCTAAAE